MPPSIYICAITYDICSNIRPISVYYIYIYMYRCMYIRMYAPICVYVVFIFAYRHLRSCTYHSACMCTDTYIRQWARGLGFAALGDAGLLAWCLAGATTITRPVLVKGGGCGPCIGTACVGALAEECFSQSFRSHS